MKKLIEFKGEISAQCREPKAPTVARYIFKGESKARYIVIGTNYGVLLTISGMVKTWTSYSGARKAAKNYVGF